MAIDRLARLAQVEKILTRLQEQWAGLENAMILAAPGDKVRYQQQIEDLRLKMRPFEEEFKQLSKGDLQNAVGAVTAEKIARLIASSEASGVPDTELEELRLLLSQLRSGEAQLLSPQITMEENLLPGGDRELYYATGRVENLGNSHPYFL